MCSTAILDIGLWLIEDLLKLKQIFSMFFIQNLFPIFKSNAKQQPFH